MGGEIILWGGVFVFSLAVLIKSSDWFTDASEHIGVALGIPSFIVGVTIVSIGTSLPELISSLYAVFQGTPEFVMGNVVGSNITNIFLIIGITALVAKRLKTTYELVSVDLPIFVGSAFFLAVTAWDGIISKPEAILCIAGYLVYLLYTINAEKTSKLEQIEETIEKTVRKRRVEPKAAGLLLLGGVGIYFGARFTVESITHLAESFNIGVELIALSAVALGTSLPELTVSVNAARKGKSELAIGNVLGSNIFNSFAIPGIVALFGVVVVPASIISFSLPLMLVATVLYFFIAQDKKITRWEGLILLIFYVFFIGKLFSIF